MGRTLLGRFLKIAKRSIAGKNTKFFFRRYSFGQEELPAWFADEEKKHTSIQLPITREEVSYYKERLKAINARPMKKLMEAQARKKRKVRNFSIFNG